MADHPYNFAAALKVLRDLRPVDIEEIGAAAHDLMKVLIKALTTRGWESTMGNLHGFPSVAVQTADSKWELGFNPQTGVLGFFQNEYERETLRLTFDRDAQKFIGPNGADGLVYVCDVFNKLRP